MEVTADKGLLLKSISPASLNLPSRNKVKTCGTDVETGQPLEHPGTLHFRHRSASDFIVDISNLRYFHTIVSIYLLCARQKARTTECPLFVGITRPNNLYVGSIL